MKYFHRLFPHFSLVSLFSFFSFPAVAANISVEFIDQGIINAGEMFEGTTVGEFSGISYGGSGNTYYAISDDENNPRFYSLNIDVDLGQKAFLQEVHNSILMPAF
ncbi:esterase-like activity of phytase family protein [Crocosphaera sp.]|uniref:esterase-like activity of phytase family protein n=1 Tax=Crocosphaera sp. TaxID=2729996 RepID=UPI003F201544|nr:esterase-like activity of phytase family protein [Crocosphaera sp.]